MAAPPHTPSTTPKHQQWYEAAEGSWQAVKRPSQAFTDPLRSLRLITWNIDMLIPFGLPRMQRALDHLSSLVTSTPAATPLVIFLQEMTSADLSLIKSTPWVLDRFRLTDIDETNWAAHWYGTVTLIDHRLPISSCFRVPMASRFGRDAAFVDIALRAHPSTTPATKVLRLCNVHLESLVATPPVRPAQLALAASHLHHENVLAGLLAGDCNAIEPFDATLHSQNGLRDAYLELHPGADARPKPSPDADAEERDEGYTWGYQSPPAERERFGCSRMDKVLFCGAAEVGKLERIGRGVCVEDEGVVREMREAGMETWVTDHLGLMADVVIR